MLLGRPGNHIKAGIVGMPNVGKSTTFNIMCNMTVPAENFPVRHVPTHAHADPDPTFVSVWCWPSSVCWRRPP